MYSLYFQAKGKQAAGDTSAFRLYIDSAITLVNKQIELQSKDALSDEMFLNLYSLYEVKFDKVQLQGMLEDWVLKYPSKREILDLLISRLDTKSAEFKPQQK